jgi:hypothetical protein
MTQSLPINESLPIVEAIGQAHIVQSLLNMPERGYLYKRLGSKKNPSVNAKKMRIDQTQDPTIRLT